MSGNQINQAFTSYFETNGTHIKCSSNEAFQAQEWFECDSEQYITVLCNTSNYPVADFVWRLVF